MPPQQTAVPSGTSDHTRALARAHELGSSLEPVVSELNDTLVTAMDTAANGEEHHDAWVLFCRWQSVQAAIEGS